MIDKIYKHIESRISYARIALMERMAVSGGVLISAALILLFFLFFLAFISIAGAIWIGREMNDIAIGFALIALFWFLLALFVVFFRESIFELPLRDLIVRLMMDEEDDEEEIEELKDQKKQHGENKNL